jgi:hypothetical protein
MVLMVPSPLGEGKTLQVIESLCLLESLCLAEQRYKRALDFKLRPLAQVSTLRDRPAPKNHRTLSL